MKIRRATEADGASLSRFFEKMTVSGAIDTVIRRDTDFFARYRLLSDDFESWIMEDDRGIVTGHASLVFREGLVNGEKQTWGYATDLRIAPTRTAIVQWAHHFLPVLEHARDERGCRMVFSTLELNGSQAYNALIRPTSHARRRLPRYHLVNRLRMVSVHGRTPFAKPPLTSIRLSPLENNDLEALCHFIHTRSKHRPLATVYTPESFLAEVGRWPGLQLADFRIARDSKRNILGYAALWDGRRVQKIIPQTYRGIAHTQHQMLWLGSFLGLTRPFAQPENVMPSLFLTHLDCDTAEVFHSLANEAFLRLGRGEFLSYLHFSGNWRTLPPRGYIATSRPYGLYLVLSPGAEVPAWPSHGLSVLPPEFDIAWL